MLVRIASKFRSAITVAVGTNTANAKSVMGVMMLAAPSGTVLSFQAVGLDPKQAIDALVTLVASDFPSLPSSGYASLSRDLGAEPCTMLVHTASKFRSAITVSVGGDSADAKGIMGVMKLAAESGWVLQFEAVGPDSKEAIDALLSLVASDFDARQLRDHS